VRQCYSEARIASRDRSNREFSRTLACIPLMHEPGSAWEYSRATDVLGVIVEAISGQSLGAFLQERIFGPLGMKDTAFSVPAEQQDRIAEPFASDPDTGEAVRLLDARVVPRMESGGGGLMSTAMDYARFLQMLLDGGQLDGVRLVSRKTIEWMTCDHLDGVPILGDILPAGHGFGLGFAVRLADGVASVAGSAGVYYWGGIAGTSFFVDPTEDLFAILMIQAPGQRDYFRPLFRNMVYAAIDG
jgi:CubicO group peptidase (beta-lactamase class C family)